VVDAERVYAEASREALTLRIQAIRVGLEARLAVGGTVP
jgi:hypothetical protein